MSDKVLYERTDADGDEETGRFIFFLPDGPLKVTEQEIVDAYMRFRRLEAAGKQALTALNSVEGDLEGTISDVSIDLVNAAARTMRLALSRVEPDA